MRIIFLNTLALIGALIAGSAVNMGLIMLGAAIVPPPAGVDVTDMESIKAGMHLFEVQHFIFPFLAHALGTLVGALVVSRLAVTHKFRFAMFVGILFFIGGVSNIKLLPSPVWFAVLDIVFAYLPMAWLGYKLSKKF